MSVLQKHWATRFENSGKWAPLWLGLGVVAVYLLVRCLLDGIFLITAELPAGFEPLWRNSLWWAEIVNAVLLGYIPAALLFAYRRTELDLRQLSPLLTGAGGDIENIHRAATTSAGSIANALKLGCIVGGAALVFLDPSLSAGAEQSISNPTFLWAVLRMPIFSLAVCMLFIVDINATRAYYHMGKNLVAVDLLDMQSLSSFASRGLRSALTWVIFTIIFSLFWLGEGTASEQNLSLLVMTLTMASAAFFMTLFGVHRNILAVKQGELERLREAIRVERSSVTQEPSHQNITSPRLANLIAYYQLIERTREWPINAANVLRFFMYLLIGLGSWLGTAVVERLLDQTLGV